MFYKIFDLQGTASQQEIARKAIDRVLFPWNYLGYGLYRKTRRRYIPVEWADLSRFGSTAAGAEAGHHEHHDHPFHVIEHRHRVLGLAWYSGRITLERTLENDPNPDLAAEVFASEAAHMADFFYMNNIMRERVYNAYHGGPSGHHGHDWFDVGTYRDYVGESFMEGFVKAYSDIPVTITGFTHATTPEVVAEIREALGPPASPSTGTPQVKPSFAVPPKNSGLWFTTYGSRRFHRNHRGLREDIQWPTREQALATGRNPCRVCNP